MTREDWPAKGQKWTEYDLKQYFINYLYNNLARKYHLAKYRTLLSESSASDVLNQLKFDIERKLKPHQEIDAIWEKCLSYRRTYLGKFKIFILNT